MRIAKTRLEILDQRAFDAAADFAPFGLHFMYLENDLYAKPNFMMTKEIAMIREEFSHVWQVVKTDDALELSRLKPCSSASLPAEPNQVYPHKCPQCGGPAYIGAFKVDCKGGCK